MNSILLLLCLIGSVCPAYSIVLTRCQLATALLEAGFKKSLLPDWICLVEAESSRNTTARGGPNKNGSYDHGLFQINDRYWCDMGKPGKDCNVKCEELESDDLHPSLECAKKVYKRHKFSAWHGWVRKCKGKALPDIDHCFQSWLTTTNKPITTTEK